MIKWLTAFLAGSILAFGSIALANPNDTKATIASRYGDYRLVIDLDNQIWTKDEWLTKGMKRARASAFMYSYSSQGLNVQMEVMYDKDQADAYVRIQRFTPDMAIKIKDFKRYFPEVYPLLVGAKAEAFTTNNELSRNFKEEASPVSLGIAITENPVKSKSSYYTVVAFNIQDEGRYIKDSKWINEDTYIKEFVIEQTLRMDVENNLDRNWYPIKNYFK